MTLSIIEPDWPAPAGVLALSTTRTGGSSKAPYASFNLAHHVADDETAVAANRAQLQQQLPPGSAIQWLEQVHGTAVVEATGEHPLPVADAAVSRERGMACAVLTADCLPVLLASSRGDCVAVAHAGWRGLQAGVLEETVAAMGAPGEQLLAWLGPAIGPAVFEVGGEVRESFLEVAECGERERVAAAFQPAAERPNHFFADIYALAKIRLRALGIEQIYGGGYCTCTESTRFFSYRRDGTTGRMASLILLTPN